MELTILTIPASCSRRPWVPPDARIWRAIYGHRSGKRSGQRNRIPANAAFPTAIGAESFSLSSDSTFLYPQFLFALCFVSSHCFAYLHSFCRLFGQPLRLFSQRTLVFSIFLFDLVASCSRPCLPRVLQSLILSRRVFLGLLWLILILLNLFKNALVAREVLEM